MPLISQTSSLTPIEYLKTYTPYSLNQNILVENIEDMVACNVIEPTSSVDLQFFFGASNTVVKVFQFTNLTSNTLLQLSFDYNSEIFETIPSSPVTLNPEQSINVTLQIRGDNVQPNTTNLSTEFGVNVTNIQVVGDSRLLSFKSINTNELSSASLGETIRIYE